MAGFDQYRFENGPGGREAFKLNDDLLPLTGMFFDVTHKSLPFFAEDPLELALDPSRDGDPGSFQGWVRFLRGTFDEREIKVRLAIVSLALSNVSCFCQRQ